MCKIRSKVSLGRKRLMSFSRSTLLKGVEERMTEASQPFGRRQLWKKRRTVASTVIGD